MESHATNLANAANAISTMMAPENGQAQVDETQSVDGSEDLETAASDGNDTGVRDTPENELSEEQSGEDEQSEEEEKPQTFTVKLDGKEVSVTLDELQKGYTRTQDYTRKTQQIAEARKAFEAETESVRFERQQYGQLLGALQTQIQQNAAPQVDMDRLYSEDPIEWVRQKELARDAEKVYAAIRSEKQRLSDIEAQEQHQNMQSFLAQQQDELIKAIPEWKNPEKAKAEKVMLIEFGQKLGFGADELKNIFDHRAVVALRKAALYDQMMSKYKGVKPVTNGPRFAKPGAAGRVSTSTESTRAQQRLARTGRVDDAADAIYKLLG